MRMILMRRMLFGVVFVVALHAGIAPVMSANALSGLSPHGGSTAAQLQTEDTETGMLPAAAGQGVGTAITVIAGNPPQVFVDGVLQSTGGTASTWPTSASTGVPAGTILRDMTGTTIRTPGTVVDGARVSGDLVINADNVVIRNSLVMGRIQIRPPYKGLMVQDVEISGPGGQWAASTEGIGYSNFTCDRCNIHGWGKGAMMDANVVVKNSWIHDIPTWGDPATGSHNEAILTLGGDNFQILNNRLDAGDEDNFSASIAFYSQWNAVTNSTIAGNLMNGGGYCLYAGWTGEKGALPRNLRISDNTFGTMFNPKCGYYGAATAWYRGSTTNVWSGNRMTDGRTVNAP